MGYGSRGSGAFRHHSAAHHAADLEGRVRRIATGHDAARAGLADTVSVCEAGITKWTATEIGREGEETLRLLEAQGVSDLSLEEMVEEMVEARDALKTAQEAVYYVERAVTERMQERGATVVKTVDGEATLTTPVTYDYGILSGLREITGPDDLVGYTPEREVTVIKIESEKWNMTKGKALAKLSHAHAEIIESAKIYGRPKIKFEAKE